MAPEVSHHLEADDNNYTLSGTEDSVLAVEENSEREDRFRGDDTRQLTASR